MIESYPLHWPLGYKTTNGHARKQSRFDQTAEKVQKYLRDELFRLGADKVVISTNVPLRKDGYFYTDMANSAIAQPGAAVYFQYKKKDVVMCCDQYLTVVDNIYAIAKSINAIRDMERWGVSDFIERTFAGFKALPEHTNGHKWWVVMGIKENATQEEIKAAYKALSKVRHPDGGGDAASFAALTDAYQEGLKQTS
jgi:DnaJ domain